ncbi:MAG TPA: RNA polymerase sigma factor [Planctomycetaceae bacterium]|nr:RNA polymerase sigma factor [Planctomycetaceae bacterium]
MEDDAELTRRILAGDREATGLLYDRYAPLVRAVLLDATGSLPDADELLQEVFVRGITRLGQLRRPERVGAWLIAIARRQGKGFRRQSVRRRQRFTPFTDHPAPGTVTAVRDTASLVREAVRELPERERMAVHIHYLCGEPAEVARRALGLSQSGFYKLLERARRRLRARLLETEEHR